VATLLAVLDGVGSVLVGTPRGAAAEGGVVTLPPITPVGAVALCAVPQQVAAAAGGCGHPRCVVAALRSWLAASTNAGDGGGVDGEVVAFLAAQRLALEPPAATVVVWRPAWSLLDAVSARPGGSRYRFSYPFEGRPPLARTAPDASPTGAGSASSAFSPSSSSSAAAAAPAPASTAVAASPPPPTPRAAEGETAAAASAAAAAAAVPSVAAVLAAAAAGRDAVRVAAAVPVIPGGTPCNHDGPCDAGVCSCAASRGACEKDCACASTCALRWRGCRCGLRSRAHLRSRLACATGCPCAVAGRECDPDLCICLHPAVARRLSEAAPHKPHACGNTALQTATHARIGIARSAIHGWGAFAREAVPRGGFVAEYVGERITTAEADRRGALADRTRTSYIFATDDATAIDALRHGSVIKFANNNDDTPNLVARAVRVAGVPRIALFATMPIPPHTELTFSYRYSGEHRHAVLRRT